MKLCLALNSVWLRLPLNYTCSKWNETLDCCWSTCWLAISTKATLLAAVPHIRRNCCRKSLRNKTQGEDWCDSCQRVGSRAVVKRKTGREYAPLVQGLHLVFVLRSVLGLRLLFIVPWPKGSSWYTWGVLALGFSDSCFLSGSQVRVISRFTVELLAALWLQTHWCVLCAICSVVPCLLRKAMQQSPIRWRGQNSL